MVGASARSGSLGRIALDNLRAAGFRGELIAVNPKHTSLGDVPCFPSLAAVGRAVDLVLLTTPAGTVPELLRDAGRAGIRNAVVLSAGFGETGGEGKRLEDEVLRAARHHQVRVIGPNCLGIMRPSIGLNASFARGMAPPGSLALVSQSGAVATSLVDWAGPAGVGFSSVISMGAGVDLDFGEILDFLCCDPETRAILLYIEGVRDARRFISGLRAAARTKPIMVLKVGRHLSGSRAAMSHTGSLAGNDAVFEAVLRRCGVVRVRTYSELFSAAALIANSASLIPAGSRGHLAIVTNGGGPGVLAADFAVDAGVSLSSLTPATQRALDALLPAHWSHANPVDVLGDANAERIRQAIVAVLSDPGVDAVLTLFCPQQVMPAREAAFAIREAALAVPRKPVLTAWLGGREVAEGRDLAEEAHLPAFDSPESAVAAFGALGEYLRAQRLLMEVPRRSPALPHDAGGLNDRGLKARDLAEGALRDGRTLLSEPEAKRLLALYGIEAPRTEVAATAPEAVAIARSLGYPVALKILSADIAHKSDVGGVILNIRDEESLRRAFEALLDRVRRLRPEAHIGGVAVQPMVEKRFGRELLIGLSTDAVFGKVVSFGAGGVAVELLRDTAIGLPPLNRLLAEDLIHRTRMSKLLDAYRHVPAVEREALLAALLAVSAMACELPWISEMDINPLVADDAGCTALDARVAIDAANLEDDARHSHLAIRPYPVELEADATLPGSPGVRLRIRPIRPEDAGIELAFVDALSDRSRHMRFFSQARGLTPTLLARFTQVDYERELALIALPAGGSMPMLGVARYSPNPDGESCEFAVTVADEWQGRGLGYLLMTRLMSSARSAGYRRMTGSVLAANSGMLNLAKSLGFSLMRQSDQPDVLEVVAPL